MSTRIIIRRGATLLVATVIAWWLFADTYRKYAESDDRAAIRFAHFGAYEDYELWRSVIADFETHQTNVRVRQEYVVGSMGHYTVKLRQQALADALPDVALVQLGPFPALADQFADVTDILDAPDPTGVPLRDELDAHALAAFRIDGVPRGIPLSGGNLAIYLNRTCFDRAGAYRGYPIPLPNADWSMADFRRTAEQLTCDFDGDGQLDQFGFWLPRWIYYLPFLWSFGADVVGADGAGWMLQGDRAEEAFTFYRRLATGDRVCPRDEEVPQLYQDTGFLTGRVAMCVNGPWFEPFLRKTTLADTYAVREIPVGPGGRKTRITWDAVAMRKGLVGSRRERATLFIRFLVSRDVQARIAKIGRAFPARTDCLDVYAFGDERRRAFVDAIPRSRLQPVLPHFAAIDRAINRLLRRLTGDSPGLSVADELTALANDPAVVRFEQRDDREAGE